MGTSSAILSMSRKRKRDEFEDFSEQSEPKRRRTMAKKRRKRRQTAKAKCLAELRVNKKRLQTRIREDKKQLRVVESDIRSLTGRRRRVA